MTETVQPNSGTGCTNSGGTNPTCVSTTYIYDAYGNKVSTSVSGDGIAARTTTTTYDARGEFPVTVTNALNQTETWNYTGTYSAAYGVPYYHTGPNGLTTYWYYDSLGRKTSEHRADSTFTNWTYTYDSGGGVPYYIYTSIFGMSGGNAVQTAPSSFEYYDTLGRAYEAVQQIYTGANQTNLSFSVKTTYYNADGQVYAADSLPETAGDVLSYYVYDPLGRPLAAFSPCTNTVADTKSCPVSLGGAYFGRTSYSYNGLITVITDAEGSTTTTSDNDMGLPATVTDTASNAVNYKYDPLGNLRSVVDPNSNTTTYVYDVAGRKTQMVDPDRGTWNYTYDALGELIKQVSPKEAAAGNSTKFTYDVLGRMVIRNQPDQVDSWIYDTATMGVGKLASEESCASVSVTGATCQADAVGPISERVQSYDSLGRPSASEIYDGGSTTGYTTTTTYDFGSRLSQITYPSGFAAQYQYDSTIGILVSLSNASTGTTLWALGLTNAAGEVSNESFANGVAVVNTYDPSTDRIVTTQAGLSTGSQAGDTTSNNVANFSYQYDCLGNLTQRGDVDADTPNIMTAPTPLSETLTYDGLYRLTGESLPGSVTKSFAYDALGNMTSKSDAGNYAYTISGHPHQLSGISGGPLGLVTYTYNADGDRNGGTGTNSYTTTWMYDDMAATITQNSVTYTYAYDADHNRISQAETGQPTIDYFNDPNTGLRSEVSISGSNKTWTDYMQAGAELIGIHVTSPSGAGTNAFFIHDHLGSVAVVLGTNSCSGLVVGGTNSCITERDSYDAWGKRRNGMNWTDDTANTIGSVTRRGYTGHEMVQNTTSGFELINMNARFYDPTIGKFFSSDPMLAPPGAPVNALNPYTYVYDNPLTLTDPTGLCGGFLGCLVEGLEDIFTLRLAVPLIEHNPWLGDVAIAAAAIGCSEIGASAECAAATEAQIAGYETGSLTAGLEAGAITGAETLAFHEVGDYTDGTGLGSVSADLGGGVEGAVGSYAAQVAGDGLVGGLASVAQGGGFESGFLAAGFAAGIAPANSLLVGSGDFAANLALQSTEGGFGSVIGGGKFANGALTGAFGYLFSQEAQAAQNGQNPFEQTGLDGLGADIRSAYDNLLGINQNPIGQNATDQALYAGSQEAQSANPPPSQDIRVAQQLTNFGERVFAYPGPNMSAIAIYNFGGASIVVNMGQRIPPPYLALDNPLVQAGSLTNDNTSR